MNTRTAVAALATLLALTLTGCAGAVDETPSEPQAFAQTAPEETPEPLVAETTEPAEVGTDAAYLLQVREALAGSGGTTIPDATNEQLIAAGHDACEQLVAGTEQRDVRVVEGEELSETGYKESIRIAGAAIAHYCPNVRD